MEYTFEVIPSEGLAVKGGKEVLAEAVVRTGVLEGQETIVKPLRKTNRQLNFLSNFG